jgi:tetratricopeptide (TPR) repeat protein
MKIIFILFILFSIPFAMALPAKDFPAVYDSYLLEKKGHLSRAIAKMTSLYKNHSEDYFVNFRLGELFSKDQKDKMAIEHFKKASTINIHSIEPWIEISKILFERKDWSQLELSTDEIIKRDDLNLFAHLKSCHALIELSKSSKALDRIGDILAAHPQNKELLEFKALAQQKNGDTESSRQTLMELVLIDPENSLAKKLLVEPKAP